MSNTTGNSQIDVRHAEGNVLELHLKGPCTFDTHDPSEIEHIISAATTMKGIRILDDGIAEWGSSTPALGSQTQDLLYTARN